MASATDQEFFATPGAQPQATPQTAPQPPANQPASPSASAAGIMIQANPRGNYADAQGNLYQPAGGDYFTDKGGARYQIVRHDPQAQQLTPAPQAAPGGNGGVGDQQFFAGQDQAPSAPQWQTVTGQAAVPVSYDRFGHGIDAQGNILQPVGGYQAPALTPVQQAYQAAHTSPAAILPGRPWEAEGLDAFGAGMRRFADAISGGWANKGDAALDAAMHPEYGGSFGDRYSAALDYQGGLSQTAGLAHPVAAATGSVAGTVGQGLAVPASAPVLGGAILGGIDAAGGSRGDARQLATDTAGGILTGGLLGGAVKWTGGGPVAAPADGLLANPAISPRASRYVGGLLGTPDPAMVAAHQAGKPVTTAEMLGPQGRTALAATARRAGTTGSAVETTMTERAAAAPEMILNDFQRHTGIAPEAAQGDMEALAETKRATTARPAYKAIETQPVTMTPELASVLQEPEVITALNQAKRLVGRNATTMGVKIDPDTGAPVLDPLTQKPVLEEQPTAVTLDLTKKMLGKAVTRDPITRQPVDSGPAGTTNVFIQRHLGALTDALAGNADAGIPAAIPGYRQALDAGGDVLKTQQAFDLGQKHLFSPGVSSAKVQAVVGKMSPAELEAYQGGQANAIYLKAQNAQLPPKSLQVPAVKAKLAATMGREKADAFIEDVGHTQAMLNNARQIAPQAGSQSTPLAAEMHAQDNPGGLRGILAPIPGDFASGALAGSLHGGLHGAATTGAGMVTLGVARRTGAALKGLLGEVGMPTTVRNEVGGILGATGDQAMTPDELAAMLKLRKVTPPASLGLLSSVPTTTLTDSRH